MMPLGPFHAHPPGPLCDRFEPHVHMADDSITIIPAERPGMFESKDQGCRVLGLWLVLGMGVWAVIIGIAVAVWRWLNA